MTELTLITLIIMLGILLSVIAWQVFSVGKTAVKREHNVLDLQQTLNELIDECKSIRSEVEALKVLLPDKKS